jgi:hypothetical protein
LAITFKNSVRKGFLALGAKGKTILGPREENFEPSWPRQNTDAVATERLGMNGISLDGWYVIYISNFNL